MEMENPTHEIEPNPNYQKVLKLMGIQSQRKNINNDSNNARNADNSNNARTIARSTTRSDTLGQKNAANSSRQSDEVLSHLCKEIQTEPLKGLPKMENLQMIFMGKNTESKDSMESKNSNMNSENGGKSNESLDTLKNRRISRKLSSRSFAPKQNQLENTNPKVKTRSASLPKKMPAHSQIPLRKSDDPEPDKMQVVNKSYVVVNRAQELGKRESEAKANRDSKINCPKPADSPRKSRTLKPSNSKTQSNASRRSMWEEKEQELKNRLKQLEEEIKQRHAQFVKKKSVEFEIQMPTAVRTSSRHKNLDSLIGMIRERASRRRLETENAQNEEAHSSKESKCLGYDVFNVEEGVDVKYLVRENQLQNRTTRSSNASSMHSMDSAMEEILRNNESFKNMLQEKLSIVSTLEKRSKSLLGNTSYDSPKSTSLTSMLRKKGIGTKSELDSSRKKYSSPIRGKRVPYLVGNSNTLENIPSLKDDCNRRSLKKPFTVPNR